jgi:hypothetical protein
MYISFDGGKTWDLPNGDTIYFQPSAMCIVRNTLVASTYNSGISISTDWGGSWKMANEGLDSISSVYPSSTTINTLVPVGNYLYASSPYRLWRRPLSEITEVPAATPISIPTGFSLEQNFPNPFNPTTEILYTLPVGSHTTIEVFDLLGRRLATLVSRFLKPGTYHSKWDASGVPSGAYLYRLTSGSYISTKKMIVIR